MKTYTKTTRKTDGVALWTMMETGPRGGRATFYAPRREGDAEPTGWEIWSRMQRDVGAGQDYVLRASAQRA